MLVVETVAKIRRAHFVQGKGIKTICREFGLSRKAVRKVIRSKATDFHYVRGTQPRLGRWQCELEGLLRSNEGKAAREQLTLIGGVQRLSQIGF